MKKYLFALFFLFNLFILPQWLISNDELLTQSESQSQINTTEYQNLIYEPQNLDDEPHNFYGEFLKMLVILGIVIGFLILLSWALRKMLNTRIQGINQSSLIKILETRHISPKSTIYFIEVMGKGLIIGESVNGLSHLSNFSFDDDKTEAITQQ